MRPLISEFSYGYAVTEELSAGLRGALSGAPIFPSLIQEGQAGGYDVGLPVQGMPLYLQFKLSDRLSRSYSLEWHLFTAPYFRIHLRPRRLSRQHQLLLDWEARGNQVFYVAPAFHEQDELNDAYLTRSVVARSTFFRPSDIGPLPDDDDHYVVFCPPDLNVMLFSREPKHIRRPTKGESFVDEILPLLRQGKAPVDRQFFESIASDLRLLAQGVPLPPAFEEQIALLARRDRPRVSESMAFAAVLTRAYLDAHLVVLFEPGDRA